ncbi:hypothetical protein [Kitasatospora sp. NPDC001132]
MTIDQGAARAESGVIGGSGPYALLGRVTEPRVTHAEVPEVFAGNVDRLRAVLSKALESLPAERGRVCSHALDGSHRRPAGRPLRTPRRGVPRPAATGLPAGGRLFGFRRRSGSDGMEVGGGGGQVQPGRLGRRCPRVPSRFRQLTYGERKSKEHSATADLLSKVREVS